MPWQIDRLRSAKNDKNVILLIDNYDSFVYNLARYFQRLGHETRVVRNDVVDLAELKATPPDAIVLSPGPCTPDVAGKSLDVVSQCRQDVPMLGVCLGHQTIARAFGANVVLAREPMHGRTSPVSHNGCGMFRGLPDPLTVCRYHSLIVDRDSLPEEFETTAWLADGTIMAIQHRQRPLFGLQFHPESILTESGYALLQSFLELSGLPTNANVAFEDELVRSPPATSVPDSPVTF